MEEALRGKADHVFLLLGSGKQKEKREKLASLRAVPANESLVVVATGKYIGEGFDEPRLDTILLAMKGLTIRMSFAASLKSDTNGAK